MKIPSKKIIGGIAIGAALIAVLSMGLTLVYSHSAARPLSTSPGAVPPKSTAASPTLAAVPTPTPSIPAAVTPAVTPQPPPYTPVPSANYTNPISNGNTNLDSSLIVNGSSPAPVSPEEAIQVFKRLNTTQTVTQNSTGASKSGLILKSVRSDRYCIYYDISYSTGTTALSTTFALLRDPGGFYNADLINQKANTQLQNMTASGSTGTLIKSVQDIMAKVNLDTTAIGLLQSVYTGPILTTNSGSGLTVSYDISDDQIVYTLTELVDNVNTATTSITLPRTIKGCDIADKNNNLSLGGLDSGIAFFQNQAAEITAASRLSLRDQTTLRDMVKRALYVTLLKRWVGPICNDFILSQDPSRFPATGIYITSLKVTGNSYTCGVTSAVNVLNPGPESSNTVYTANGSIIDALNQTGTDIPNNAAIESNLYSDMTRENGYKSVAARHLYQIATAADDHVTDLKDQQVQVPFPLKNSTGQAYKGPMLLGDPKTRIEPKDGLRVLRSPLSTTDTEVMSAVYCKSGTIADTTFWLAKTPGAVNDANAREYQAQTDLRIISIQAPSAALNDLMNIHSAIITQNSNVKKSGKNLIPAAETTDDILKLKTQKIFYNIDPLMPVLRKSDPMPIGGNGIMASKDFQISTDGSYINCYIQFFYRDTLIKRDPVDLTFQLPITEYGRAKTALPTIQALMKNPPVNLPADAGIASLAEFLTNIQSYINSNLVPANIISN